MGLRTKTTCRPTMLASEALATSKHSDWTGLKYLHAHACQPAARQRVSSWAAAVLSNCLSSAPEVEDGLEGCWEVLDQFQV